MVGKIMVVEDIKKGEIITHENVRSIRPGNGLLPENINELLGKKVKENVEKGTPVSWELVGYE
jgi:pseudaminic acid synthase